MAMLQRLTNETGIPANGVRDIAFLGFSHPGHLAPEDLDDMGARTAGTPKH